MYSSNVCWGCPMGQAVRQDWRVAMKLNTTMTLLSRGSQPSESVRYLNRQVTSVFCASQTRVWDRKEAKKEWLSLGQRSILQGFWRMARSLPGRIKVGAGALQAKGGVWERPSSTRWHSIDKQFIVCRQWDPLTGLRQGCNMVRLTFYKDILAARKVENEWEGKIGGKETNQLQACCQESR